MSDIDYCGDDLFDYQTCLTCGGQGSLEISKPQHDDPHFCEVVECWECNGSGITI
jgi:DnaJ-class molecular chaperone